MKYLLLQIENVLNGEIFKESTRDLNFFEKLYSTTWDDVKEYLPFLISGILTLIVFYLLASWVEKRAIKLLRSRTKAKNVLVANFFGKVIFLIILLIGISISLNIFGFKRISTGVLGAAGLGTFVVGFALKDIFENFLAGVIIAFDPPFILGSWIHVDGNEGLVKEMSLRQTLLKTFDGQDVYIPNSIILKNPLRNYTIDGYLRKSFVIGLDYGDDLPQGLQIITDTLSKQKNILNTVGRKPAAIIEEFSTSTVNVRCQYWIDTLDNSVPTAEISNNAMLSVLSALDGTGHYLPADILEIKVYDPQKKLKDDDPLKKSFGLE